MGWWLQVTVELLPDSSLAATVEAKEKERLSKAKADMSPEQIQAVIRETEELKLRQVRDSLLIASSHPPACCACAQGATIATNFVVQPLLYFRVLLRLLSSATLSLD